MTESRCDDFACLFIEFQIDLLEVSDHFFFRNVCSKQLVDLFRIKWYSYRLFLLAVYINHSSDNFTGSHLFDQLACTVNGCLCIIWIQTLLEFTGCIGTKSDLLA